MSRDIVVLAVDPSTLISGFCLGKNGEIIHCGVLRAPKELNSELRVEAQLEQLLDIVGRARIHRVDILIVEKPDTWAGGRGVRAAMSGALAMLARAEGVITTTLKTQLQPKKVITVEPIKWKGQIPKPVMFDRVCARYKLSLSKTYASFNITDAVGLYDWYLNEYSIDNRAKKLPEYPKEKML